jgi:hypothetical protein
LQKFRHAALVLLLVSAPDDLAPQCPTLGKKDEFAVCQAEISHAFADPESDLSIVTDGSTMAPR